VSAISKKMKLALPLNRLELAIDTVIPGLDGKGKKEYLTTEGRLEDFEVAGNLRIKNYFYFSLFYLILCPFKDFKNFGRIWEDDKWKGSALHYPIY
jgi:hypothetical protein